MLDVRRLRVLSEVAARGSFSAAAAALRLTQSAVSQHVAALEREVGLPLVERGTRPVELTEAGHALTRHATGIFARLDGAEQELGEIARRRHGRLRFGSFPTALATLVPPAYARFRRRHPEVTLTVRTGAVAFTLLWRCSSGSESSSTGTTDAPLIFGTDRGIPGTTAYRIAVAPPFGHFVGGEVYATYGPQTVSATTPDGINYTMTRSFVLRHTPER